MAQEKRSGGCLGCITGLLSAMVWWVVLLSLGTIVLLVHSEPDLEQVEGLGERATQEEVDLLRGRLAGARMGEATTFTEREINRYLAATVRGAQSEKVSQWVSFEVVGLDFTEGAFEVYLVRRFLKQRSVLSLRLVMEEDAETRRFKFLGGRAGKLPLVGGVAMVGGKAFERLYGVLQKEVAAVLGAKEVEFAAGELRLRGYEERE